jgi:hypothetical protein
VTNLGINSKQEILLDFMCLSKINRPKLQQKFIVFPGTYIHEQAFPFDKPTQWNRLTDENMTPILLLTTTITRDFKRCQPQCRINGPTSDLLWFNCLQTLDFIYRLLSFKFSTHFIH